MNSEKIKKYINSARISINSIELENLYTEVNERYDSEKTTVGCDFRYFSKDESDEYRAVVKNLLKKYDDVVFVINNDDELKMYLSEDECAGKILFVKDEIVHYMQKVDIYLALDNIAVRLLRKFGRVTMFLSGNIPYLESLRADKDSPGFQYYSYFAKTNNKKLQNNLDVARLFYGESLPEEELKKMAYSEKIGWDSFWEHLEWMVRYPEFRQAFSKASLDSYNWEVMRLKNKEAKTENGFICALN